MKRLRIPRSPEEIVLALGGLAKVCELTGANVKQAWHWHGRAGSFPSNTYFVMQRALKARGYSAPAKFWNMKGLDKVA